MTFSIWWDLRLFNMIILISFDLFITYFWDVIQWEICSIMLKFFLLNVNVLKSDIKNSIHISYVVKTNEFKSLWCCFSETKRFISGVVSIGIWILNRTWILILKQTKLLIHSTFLKYIESVSDKSILNNQLLLKINVCVILSLKV